MKKLLGIIAMALMLKTAAVCAQNATVKLGWDAYTNDVTVSLIKIYAVQGTNTVFLTNNTNATVVKSTPVVNTSLTISNLTSGAWTFTATAYSTNGLESANSNVIWTNLLPGVVTTLRFQ